MIGIISLIVACLGTGFTIGFTVGKSLNKQQLSDNKESCPFFPFKVLVKRIGRTVVSISCDFLRPDKLCNKSKDRCMFFPKFKLFAKKPNNKAGK